MKTVLKEVDVMKQYTELVEGLIKEGRIMKIVGGSNSMYEYATHFEPVNKEYDTLMVALERKNDVKGEIGLENNFEVDVLDLVVKNTKGTFDDGQVLYTKRFFQLRSGNKKFYVDTVEGVKEILDKRMRRWESKRGSSKKVEFKPTESFLEKVKVKRGFTNAKKEDVKVTKLGYRGYEVENTALKTRPTIGYRFQ